MKGENWLVPQRHQPLLGRETEKELGVLAIGLPSQRVINVNVEESVLMKAFLCIKEFQFDQKQNQFHRRFDEFQ